QKWCPEAFDTSPVAVFRSDGPVFESDLQGLAPGMLSEETEWDRTFRAERGLGDPSNLMGHLSALERTTICELVEQDVSRAYAEREVLLRAELEAARDREVAELRAAQEAFAASWTEATDAHLQQIAGAAARLALQLAGKIVRRVAADDAGVLTRAVETVFYGAGTRDALAVTVHPDDAAWLEANPTVRERLRIGTVTPDRRVERGGCLLAADGREWDATLQSQLDTLGEVLEEWVTTLGRDLAAGDGGR
ncbi:MAG TPA: FliH/SctL family protein, partial [Candidatus Krumholzibacteria bacterium]|nr:FliH/SctL family protein [Candidatus Krumholzibacteria bacterium]